MDNLDETQSIHLSLKLHPYLQSIMCQPKGEGGGGGGSSYGCQPF